MNTLVFPLDLRASGKRADIEGFRAVRTSRFWLMVPIIFSVLAGCSTPGFDISQSRVNRLERQEGAPSTTFASVGRSEVRPYRIQPGDLLAVQFFFNPELNQSIRVQPDGAITLPFLGTRMVQGMNIPDVSEMVREVFAAELRQPQVVVQLVEAAARQVYVGGAVNSPKEVAYRPGLTPLEVVLAAGGFASSAESNEVILIRKGAEGRPVPTVVNLEDMVMQADASVALEPWDIVFVPTDRISKANAWVDKYVRGLLMINGISFGYQLNPDKN